VIFRDTLDATADRQARVDGVLEGFFSLAKDRAQPLGAEYVQLWKTLEDNTRGGKRFRPRMVFAAFEALGGTNLETAAFVGAAFELLHTALIVHDDVIDHDFVRRGVSNISGSYRERSLARGSSQRIADHSGISAAVIAGDLALFNSYRLIDKAGVSPVVRERLLEVMDEALFASAAGELIDVDFSSLPEMPQVADILNMERLKTAVYSFESPLQAGAIVAGAAEDIVATLGDFGREIGIAYQIVDDLLGLFGAEEETGKTTLGDLREGKRTVMISFAATTSAWASISQLVGNPDLTEAEAAEVRTALIQCGAQKFAEDLADSYGQKALARLNEPHIPENLRAELHPVAETVIGRVK
jgi:geranylgeranyl diphosphate synthase type II